MTPRQTDTPPLNRPAKRYLKLAAPNFRATRHGAVRLLTLVLLRWMAVGGQTLALIITGVLMGYDLPMMPTMAAVLIAAIVNIFLSIQYRSTQWLSTRGAELNLAFDTVQLSVLLYLTGGLANPFALLFLVPVTVSATILTVANTARLYALALVCITGLALWHEPLPWIAGSIFDLPQVYLIGIWVALAFGMAFISGYVSLVVREAQSMGDALQATQMALERERRVSEMGALAAAAAHELGTPLNTIRLLIAELEEELEETTAEDGNMIQTDLRLMVQEVNRCKRILDGIADAHKQTEMPDLKHLSPAALLEDVATPHRDHGKHVTVINGAGPDLDKPVTIERTPEVVHALGVLIENAVDFAKSEVTLTARWTDEYLILDVEDDGPGIDEDLLESLGQPFVSGRPAKDERRRQAIDPKQALGTQQRGGGMGLGVFIARTLLERTDGILTFDNRLPQGAHAQVVWHLEDLTPGHKANP